MVGNNKINWFMKMIENMKVKMEESDKKVEAIAIVLQNITNKSQVESDEQPSPVHQINKEGKGEMKNKKNEPNRDSA